MDHWLLINLSVSWALVGLIWTIQLVHYPSFLFVEKDQFSAFHYHHTRQITIVVMPLMLVELFTTIYLAYLSSWASFWVAALLIVILIWGITFSLAIPLHNQLEAEKNQALIKRLVLVNWPRTLLWSIKGLGLIGWLMA